MPSPASAEVRYILSSSMPSPVERCPFNGTSVTSSVLLRTIIYGICLSLILLISALILGLLISINALSSSNTIIAISQELSVCNDFSTRSSPSSPSSSRPGVSIKTTGPSGNISIAFLTGSVVVPATLDTTAKSCPVIALIRVDLPALRLPNIPMWVRSEEGVAFNDIHLLRRDRGTGSLSRFD